MVPPMLTNLELTERGTESVKIHKELNDRASVERNVRYLSLLRPQFCVELK